MGFKPQVLWAEPHTQAAEEQRGCRGQTLPQVGLGLPEGPGSGGRGCAVGPAPVAEAGEAFWASRGGPLSVGVRGGVPHCAVGTSVELGHALKFFGCAEQRAWCTVAPCKCEGGFGP